MNTKLPYQIITNFILKFVSKKDLKIKKKIYPSHLQPKIEFQLAFTTFTAFDITYSHCPIKKCMEFYVLSNQY